MLTCEPRKKADRRTIRRSSVVPAGCRRSQPAPPIAARPPAPAATARNRRRLYFIRLNSCVARPASACPCTAAWTGPGLYRGDRPFREAAAAAGIPGSGREAEVPDSCGQQRQGRGGRGEGRQQPRPRLDSSYLGMTTNNNSSNQIPRKLGRTDNNSGSGARPGRVSKPSRCYGVRGHSPASSRATLIRAAIFGSSARRSKWNMM